MINEEKWLVFENIVQHLLPCGHERAALKSCRKLGDCRVFQNMMKFETCSSSDLSTFLGILTEKYGAIVFGFLGIGRKIL